MDFRGAADEAGNLYWIEYDPPRTADNWNPPAWLASSDSDGKNRYRFQTPLLYSDSPGAFLVAGGKVVMSSGAALAAYDALSGAAAWSIDLSATYLHGYAEVRGIADLGNGELAFAMYDYNNASGIYLVDGATGAILWSTVGADAADYQVIGADGSGRALVRGNESSEPGYHTSVDLFAIDGSGTELWKHRVIDARALIAWPSDLPWLWIAGTQSLSPKGDYVASPTNWFSAVDGNAFGFAVEFGPTATTPNKVNVIRNGAVFATGALAGTNSYDGTAAFPFLAGDAGNHLVLLTQTWHGSPGLCHPETAGAAALWRFDSVSSYQCPFTFQGESGIEGAALLKDRVIIGRRTYLSQSCGLYVNPVTIEAYGLPGESLAPSGWVQRGGSPGMGMRPRRR